MEEIEGIGVERDLAGLPVITPPENVDIWDTKNPEAVKYLAVATSLVRSIRRDANEGIVKPHGWDLALLSTGGSRQFDTNAIINRYDNRIAITLLADIVMMGGDKVGSFALGEVKQSLLSASLEATIMDIADTFNNFAVPELFKLNGFKAVNLPKIMPGEIETPNLKDLAFILRAGGLDVQRDLPLMNLVRRLISIDPLTQEEFETLYKKPAEEAKEVLEEDKKSIDMDEDDELSVDKDPIDHAMDDQVSLDQGR